MSKLCVIFLITSSLAGCATTPTPTRFDADWEFCYNSRGELRACIPEDDVKELREILIREGSRPL